MSSPPAAQPEDAEPRDVPVDIEGLRSVLDRDADAADLQDGEEDGIDSSEGESDEDGESEDESGEDVTESGSESGSEEEGAEGHAQNAASDGSDADEQGTKLVSSWKDLQNNAELNALVADSLGDADVESLGPEDVDGILDELEPDGKHAGSEDAVKSALLDEDANTPVAPTTQLGSPQNAEIGLQTCESAPDTRVSPTSSSAPLSPPHSHTVFNSLSVPSDDDQRMASDTREALLDERSVNENSDEEFSSSSSGEESGDMTDGSESDSDGEDTNRLSYQYIGANLLEEVQTDRCTAFCAHQEVLVMGCESGTVFVFDVFGLKKRMIRAHKSPVRSICISKSGSFIASGSEKGTVTVSEWRNQSHLHLKYRTPISTITLCPNYKVQREVMSGDATGKVVLNSKGWFSAKDQTVFSSKSPVYCLKWQGRYVAWVTDQGLYLYDMGQTKAVGRVSIPRGSLDPAEFRPCLLFLPPRRIIVSYGNCIQIANLTTATSRRSGPRGKPITESKTALKVVACIPTSYIVCGLAPFGDELAVLAYDVMPADDSSSSSESSDDEPDEELDGAEAMLRELRKETVTVPETPPSAESKSGNPEAASSPKKRSGDTLDAEELVQMANAIKETGICPSFPQLRLLEWATGPGFNFQESSCDELELQGYEYYLWSHYSLDYVITGSEVCLYVITPRGVVEAKPKSVEEHLKDMRRAKKYRDALRYAAEVKPTLQQSDYRGCLHDYLTSLLTKAQTLYQHGQGGSTQVPAQSRHQPGHYHHMQWSPVQVGRTFEMLVKYYAMHYHRVKTGTAIHNQETFQRLYPDALEPDPAQILHLCNPVSEYICLCACLDSEQMRRRLLYVKMAHTLFLYADQPEVWDAWVQRLDADLPAAEADLAIGCLYHVLPVSRVTDLPDTEPCSIVAKGEGKQASRPVQQRWRSMRSTAADAGIVDFYEPSSTPRQNTRQVTAPPSAQGSGGGGGGVSVSRVHRSHQLNKKFLQSKARQAKENADLHPNAAPQSFVPNSETVAAPPVNMACESMTFPMDPRRVVGNPEVGQPYSAVSEKTYTRVLTALVTTNPVALLTCLLLWDWQTPEQEAERKTTQGDSHPPQELKTGAGSNPSAGRSLTRSAKPAQNVPEPRALGYAVARSAARDMCSSVQVRVNTFQDKHRLKPCAHKQVLKFLLQPRTCLTYLRAFRQSHEKEAEKRAAGSEAVDAAAGAVDFVKSTEEEKGAAMRKQMARHCIHGVGLALFYWHCVSGVLHRRLDKLPECLDAMLATGDNELFGLVHRHPETPWVQFHIKELVAAYPRETSTFLVSHRQLVGPAEVCPQLVEVGEGNSGSFSIRDKFLAEWLCAYLDELYQIDPEAGADYHLWQIELYARFQPDKLVPFLDQPNEYDVDVALEIAERFNLYQAQVNLLRRRKAYKKALHIMIDQLHDVPQGIDLVTQGENQALMEELLVKCLSNPKILSELLAHVHVSLVDVPSLLGCLPRDLEIPDLKLRIQRLFSELSASHDVEMALTRMFSRDLQTCRQRYHAERQRGMAVPEGATCEVCGGSAFGAALELPGDPSVEEIRRSNLDLSALSPRRPGVTVFFCQHVFHSWCLKKDPKSRQAARHFQNWIKKSREVGKGVLDRLMARQNRQRISFTLDKNSKGVNTEGSPIRVMVNDDPVESKTPSPESKQSSSGDKQRECPEDRLEYACLSCAENNRLLNSVRHADLLIQHKLISRYRSGKMRR